MATYDLGDPVALSVTVRDATGAPANAGAIVLTVTAPDGTAVLPVVSNPSAGVYTATYTPTVAGRFVARWVATGTNAAAFVDDFTVTAATGVLLAVADLEAHLHRTISSADTTSADAACTFANALVTDVCGFDPVAGTYTVTAADIDLARGVAVRIAAQHFTNPEDRQSYAGPEGLSYTSSPQMLSRLMSEADRRTLVGIQLRYAPGFA